MAKLKQSIKALGYAFNGQEPSGYYVTEMLKSFGSSLTEQPIKGKGIAEILGDIANKQGLKVEAVADDTIDLLGKVASDLQANILFEEAGIKGTSHYVKNYTGFSSKASEQKGNYIALKATSKQGATITAELLGGKKGAVTLDNDGIIIFLLNPNAYGVRFVATKDNEKYVVEYALNLTLEEDE